jgi:hypothetical protein
VRFFTMLSAVAMTASRVSRCSELPSACSPERFLSGMRLFANAGAVRRLGIAYASIGISMTIPIQPRVSEKVGPPDFRKIPGCCYGFAWVVVPSVASVS